MIFSYVSPLFGTTPLAIPLLSLFNHETGCGPNTSTARNVEGIGHFKRYIFPYRIEITILSLEFFVGDG